MKIDNNYSLPAFKALKIDKFGQQALNTMKISDMDLLYKLGNDTKVKFSKYYDIVFSKNGDFFLQPKTYDRVFKNCENIFNKFKININDSFNPQKYGKEEISQTADNEITANIVEPKYGVLGTLNLRFNNNINIKSLLDKYLNSPNQFEKIKKLLIIFELAEQYERNHKRTIQEKLSDFFI